jgi:hypothetical protein
MVVNMTSEVGFFALGRAEIAGPGNSEQVTFRQQQQVRGSELVSTPVAL